MADSLAQAEELIPCEVRMISGCRDEQTSADGTFVCIPHDQALN
jgi:hypothetical protein